MKKALVVLSGGQDSTVCLFWAKQNFDEVHAITFNYGQRHSLEIKSAKIVAEMAGVKSHEIIDIPNILKSSSPLTSDNELEQYSDFKTMDKIIGDRRELTFVPMRNPLFLTIAANRAEAIGATEIVTGVCQMDGANYDDCRQIFINFMETMINTALGYDHRSGDEMITLHTPLMTKSKAQTCWMAWDLGLECWSALAYSHTSYDGQFPPTDNNHANILRAEGFRQAGLPDPLVVRAYNENLMPLPDTVNYSTHNLSEYPYLRYTSSD